MGLKTDSFSPDDANKLNRGQCLSIVVISAISVAMIGIGALPIFSPSSTAPSPSLTVLCVLLVLSGVFILYSILFNLFRIIERNQRRQYEWESAKAKRSVNNSSSETE